MTKILTTIAVAAFGLTSFCADAITFKCDRFKESSMTCRLIGWEGEQPEDGILQLPSTFTDDNGSVYTITVVDDNALNNLTKVKEITIPASYKEIGRAYATYVVNARLHNFENCPSLVKFIVEEGSPLFEASSNGVLYLKGGKTMMKMPQSFKSNSDFTIPESCQNIAPDAFAGNSTIFYLEIPASTIIYENGGLNRMENLSVYKLLKTSKEELTEKGGIIFHKDRIVACPPFGAVVSYSIPDDITKISDYAFYNCVALKSLTLPASVTEIGEGAFAFSSISQLTLPENLDKLGKEAAKNCKELTKVTFQNELPEISDRFAADCPALTEIASEKPITLVGEAAFKNCRELKSFPFRGETVLSEDSAFFNTGFEKIIFEKSDMADSFYGSNVFSYCRNLELIDFSNLNMTYPGHSLSIGDSFAKNCMKLKTIIFGDFTGFWEYKLVDHTTPPAFGYSCVADTIVIGSTGGSNYPQFCYSTFNGQQHFTPKVYARTTHNAAASPKYYNRLNIGKLFFGANGATVAPIIYLDAYKLAEPEWPDFLDYVVPDASYYIPGGTLANYGAAVDNGNTVEEMFTLTSTKTEGNKLLITVTPKDFGEEGPELTDFKAIFPSGAIVDADEEGLIEAPENIGSYDKIRLAYSVNGYEYLTDYPASYWMASGVMEIESGFHYTKSGRILSFGENVRFEVYGIDGKLLLTGYGSSADLSALPSGIVVLKVATANGTAQTLKLTL